VTLVLLALWFSSFSTWNSVTEEFGHYNDHLDPGLVNYNVIIPITGACFKGLRDIFQDWGWLFIIEDEGSTIFAVLVMFVYAFQRSLETSYNKNTTS
jgi:hypothetical protein